MGACVLMTENNAHIVDLKRLEVGQYDYAFSLSDSYFREIEDSFLLGGDIEVRAHLALREQDFDLMVSIDGKVMVTCDRCLEPMSIELNEEQKMEFDDEPEVLDLNWLAYELIIVNLPTVHCHPEGGCNPEMIALLQDHLCRTDEEPEYYHNDN